jgi:uncharacterized protein YukE
MARLGVDDAEVERVGNGLRTQANQLHDVMNQIGTLVSQAVAVWEGNDALQLQEWWNSQHKPALEQARQAIAGLGQSAPHNAAAQRDVPGH